MKRKASVEPKEQVISPRERLVNAYDDLDVPLMKEHADKRHSILDNHRMQIRSAAVEANHYPAVVWEGSENFIIYAKLHLTKPLYRKLDLIAQLEDKPLDACICDMIEQEVQTTLENSDELADGIRKRILEEAYGLGREDARARKEKLDGALKAENG